MNGAHVPGCTGKIKHGTQQGALESAERTGRRHGRKGNASAYACRHCGCWHVTTLHGDRARRDEAQRARNARAQEET